MGAGPDFAHCEAERSEHPLMPALAGPVAGSQVICGEHHSASSIWCAGSRPLLRGRQGGICQPTQEVNPLRDQAFRLFVVPTRVQV